MTTKVANIGEINIGNIAQPPFVRLPDPTTLFERRAQRLIALAPANPLSDYLEFIAALVQAQAEVLRSLPDATLPGADQIAFFHEHKLPLLDRQTWERDPSWHAALDGICASLRGGAGPEAALAALDGIAGLDAAAREALAEQVLGPDAVSADPALACFVHAALQVHWTRMAARLDPATVQAIEPVPACPVCGSMPIASIVHAEGSLQGVRFLVCGLCNTEWHSVRIKCANCQSTKGIAYQHIAEHGGGVKAETCDECRTYTKILYRDKEPQGEPFADDLASVALDILVGEAGWARAMPNPFLVPATD